MVEVLEKHYRNFRNERVQEIANAMHNRDVGYRELVDKVNNLCEELEKYIPEAQLRLLDELTEIEAAIQGRVEDVMYHDGMRDGIRLCSLMGKI